LKQVPFIRKLFGHRVREEETSYENLNAAEKDMIRGIVELSQTTVKEVMVPRIDVVFISADVSLDELMASLIESGHSRFPVYKDTIDNVIGTLYAKDLLSYLYKNEEINIESIIRKAYFIPESKRLDSMLREFRLKKVHIAVAVDEYGGVSGIVCLEDILEEIVGEIQDEFDHEIEDILEIGTGIYLCDARVDIEDLNEKLEMNIPNEDYDTLGGFVFDLFGKIPVKFEKVGYGPANFIIQDMDGHKIKTIKVVKKAEEPDAE
jgi:magnesium and cobalt transporter